MFPPSLNSWPCKFHELHECALSSSFYMNVQSTGGNTSQEGGWTGEGKGENFDYYETVDFYV